MKNRYYDLLALSLGDGSIYRNHLDIAHHIKNEDYIKFKSDILEYHNIKHKVSDKKNNTTLFKRIITSKNYILSCIHKALYKENFKIFKKKWIYNLNDLHLAILWMDDGCFVRQRQKLRNGSPYIYECGEIATQSFDLQSNLNIVEWLDQFEIDSYVLHDKKRNLYRIKLNRENLYKLVEIIEPFVKQVPSMLYKLGY